MRRKSAQLKLLHPEPPINGVVPLLEDLLEQARRGELSSIAVAIVYRDGASGRGWSKIPSHAALLGSVARLQHCLLTSID
jgi:hypothetical protein